MTSNGTIGGGIEQSARKAVEDNSIDSALHLKDLIASADESEKAALGKIDWASTGADDFTIEKEVTEFGNNNAGDKYSTEETKSSTEKVDFAKEMELKNQLVNKVEAYNNIVIQIQKTENLFTAEGLRKGVSSEDLKKLIEVAESTDHINSSYLVRSRSRNEMKQEIDQLEERMKALEEAAGEIEASLKKLLELASDAYAAEKLRDYINGAVNDSRNEAHLDNFANMCVRVAADLRIKSRTPGEKLIDGPAETEEKPSLKPLVADEKDSEKAAVELLTEKNKNNQAKNITTATDESKLDTPVPNLTPGVRFEGQSDKATTDVEQPIIKRPIEPIKNDAVPAPVKNDGYVEDVVIDPTGKIAQRDTHHYEEKKLPGDIPLAHFDAEKLRQGSGDPIEKIKGRLKNMPQSEPPQAKEFLPELGEEEELKDLSNGVITVDSSAATEVPTEPQPLKPEVISVADLGEGAKDDKKEPEKGPDLIQEDANSVDSAAQTPALTTNEPNAPVTPAKEKQKSPISWMRGLAKKITGRGNAVTSADVAPVVAELEKHRAESGDNTNNQ